MLNIALGYGPVGEDDHARLLIEFKVDGMGTPEDVEKRTRLQSRMDETLGWTGLGRCDGGSIGSGTMEVCCFVVDFETARQVIEKTWPTRNSPTTQEYSMRAENKKRTHNKMFLQWCGEV